MRYVTCALILALAACGGDAGPPVSTAAITFALESDAFSDGGAIPARYTCDGEDVSPSLAWGEVPAATESLALMVDDPDAPVGTWDHWILFNIPASTRLLAEGISAKETIAGIGMHGQNSWKEVGYGGPCPPAGSEHRYQFRLYALDTVLAVEPGATKGKVIDAMEGHVLAQGELTGLYGR